MRLSRLILASVLVLSPLAARADVVFTLTSVTPGGYSGSFQVPTTISGAASCCLTVNTTNYSRQTLDQVTFYSGPAPDYGGLTIDSSAAALALDPTVNPNAPPATSGFSGPQLFAYANGVYTFNAFSGDQLYFYNASASGPIVETVSVVSVSSAPEPSSLMLLGTGALGLAGAVRRRLRK